MAKKVEEMGKEINKLLGVKSSSISKASKKKLGRSRRESKAKQGDDKKKKDEKTLKRIRDIRSLISKLTKELAFMLDHFPLMFDEFQIRAKKQHLAQLMSQADALLLHQLKALG